jgi:PhnB protein
MPKKALTPIPEGVHTVTPYLIFAGDCGKALEFYQKALGAQLPMPPSKAPDGKIMNAFLKIGDSMIMLSDTFHHPDKVAGMKTNLWLYVDDSDAYFNRAIKAGCGVTMKMEDAFWGDRVGQVIDPFGHIWNFATQKWILSPQEMKRGEDEWLKAFNVGNS